MKTLVLALVAAACGPRIEDDIALPPPDSGDEACGIGAFDIGAPRAGLRYAPSLDVEVYESELQGALSLSIHDDGGTSYPLLSQQFGANPTDAGAWWSLDRFHYELAPSQHYTLKVRHCEQIETVSFFTRSP
jgi:hypothetical protein